MDIDAFIPMLAFWEELTIFSWVKIWALIITISAVRKMPALYLLFFLRNLVRNLNDSDIVLV